MGMIPNVIRDQNGDPLLDHNGYPFEDGTYYVECQPPTGALSLAGHSPIIEALDGTYVEPLTGSVNVTGLQSEIVVGADFVAIPATGTISFQGIDPALPILVSTGTLNFNGLAPEAIVRTRSVDPRRLFKVREESRYWSIKRFRR